MTPAQPTLAVFASEQGPGDAERASIMSQAGAYLARRGARLVCLAEGDEFPTPLVTAARAAGGTVTLVADGDFVPPPAIVAPVERHDDVDLRLDRVAELADVLIGLPGSLHSGSRLYQVWTRGGAAGRLPVVVLNRNRAFEILRGFAADVLSHSVKRHDRGIQFADSVEDLWNKTVWILGEAEAARR